VSDFCGRIGRRDLRTSLASFFFERTPSSLSLPAPPRFLLFDSPPQKVFFDYFRLTLNTLTGWRIRVFLESNLDDEASSKGAFVLIYKFLPFPGRILSLVDSFLLSLLSVSHRVLPFLGRFFMMAFRFSGSGDSGDILFPSCPKPPRFHPLTWMRSPPFPSLS